MDQEKKIVQTDATSKAGRPHRYRIRYRRHRHRLRRFLLIVLGSLVGAALIFQIVRRLNDWQPPSSPAPQVPDDTSVGF